MAKCKPATGTLVKTKLGLWQGIITLPSGKRKRLPPFPPGTSEAMAREKTAWASERHRRDCPAGSVLSTDFKREKVLLPAPMPAPQHAGVYCAWAGGNMVKIGKAKDIHRRLKELRCANPALEVVAVISKEPSDEARIHQEFKHLRREGEWFVVSGSLKRRIWLERFPVMAS